MTTTDKSLSPREILQTLAHCINGRKRHQFTVFDSNNIKYESDICVHCGFSKEVIMFHRKIKQPKKPKEKSDEWKIEVLKYIHNEPSIFDSENHSVNMK